MIEVHAQNVLVLGAHPDDEMACSGLIARLAREGARVEAVAFSDCADLIPDGFTVADLRREYAEATDFLGIAESTVLEVPNRNFPEHRQELLAVMDWIGWSGTDLVLVPSLSDAHQDHHQVAEEAIRAFKRTTILGYDLPMNTILDSRRNAYVRLDEDLLNVKVRHAQTYRSQAGRPYMTESFIRGLATVRGVQAGVQYAESYEVLRWVW